MGYSLNQKKVVAPTAQHGYWGRFTAAAELPNVAGSTVQSPEVDNGDWAWSDANAAMFICTDSTLGAAVWAQIAAGGSNIMSVTSKLAVPVTLGFHNLFVITGTVRVLSLWTYVSTVVGAAATSVAVGIDPTIGATTSIATAKVITNNAEGTMYGVVVDPTGAAPPNLVGFPGVAAAGGVPLVVAPGTLVIEITGGTTGALDWYCLWEPMTVGATLTAAP
jgi:hypothetical protein